MLYLTLNVSLQIPLELEGILPARLATLTPVEIAKLPVAYGNRTEELGQFFSVAGDGRGLEFVIQGDGAKLNRVGERLDQGRMVVEGNVGWQAGSQMTGGELVIRGHAGPWLGAELRGGRIRVLGNATDFAGSAYVGSLFGMRGGEILIQGHAGHECGTRMRRGLLAVSGRVGTFAGHSMIAGTILAREGFGPGAGAGMKRGTLLTCTPPEIAPGFAYSCTHTPAYVGLLLNQLQELRFEPTQHLNLPRVQVFRGDLLTGGRGELLVADYS